MPRNPVGLMMRRGIRSPMVVVSNFATYPCQKTEGVSRTNPPPGAGRVLAFGSLVLFLERLTQRNTDPPFLWTGQNRLLVSYSPSKEDDCPDHPITLINGLAAHL